MDHQLEIFLVGRLILAAFLGAVIGWERELHVGIAGIRTHAAVAMGACLFGLISIYLIGAKDPSRIAAQIVTGVGFLGAGVILRDQGKVRGLTTAATLWATASMGLAIATQMYVLGIATTLILVTLLSINKLPKWFPRKLRTKKYQKDELNP